MRVFEDLRIGEYFVVHETGALMCCYQKKSLSSAWLVDGDVMMASSRFHGFKKKTRVYLLLDAMPLVKRPLKEQQ